MADRLPDAAIQALTNAMRGRVIEPSDPDYNIGRRVYNGMIDRHPRLITRCADVADVIASVNFAREHGLLLSVKGGGHNVAGLAVCDDGLMLDLGQLRGIRVDPRAETVRVDGGCTWGDVDHATHAFGCAVPSGLISTTGVAGLTLGGGHGHLTRRYGLTCDNLISADVVTADGEFIQTGLDENPDLFWGLRGGGGNFGVVTSFEFRMRPVDTVMGGPLFYSYDKAGDVLRFYREYIKDAPEEMSVFFGFHREPPQPFIPGNAPDTPTCMFAVCYTGPMEEAEEAMRPIRNAVKPDQDMVGRVPFPALQMMFDPLLPPGLQHYWKGDFFKGISDELINIHLEHGHVPSFRSVMHIYPINGAPQRVSRHDTAFSYREADFSVVIAAMYDDPSQTPEMIAWVRDYWSAIHPHSIGGAYVNFLGDEGQERVQASYRDDYGRLVQLKNKYDPNNLFRMNQNIRPSV